MAGHWTNSQAVKMILLACFDSQSYGYSTRTANNWGGA